MLTSDSEGLAEVHSGNTQDMKLLTFRQRQQLFRGRRALHKNHPANARRDGFIDIVLVEDLSQNYKAVAHILWLTGQFNDKFSVVELALDTADHNRCVTGLDGSVDIVIIGKRPAGGVGLVDFWWVGAFDLDKGIQDITVA